MSDSLRERLDYEKYSPNLFDLNEYYQDIGFVGDEETRLILPIAIIRRKSVGIVSGSGTGKTAIADATNTLFKPFQIYNMEAGSQTAEIYKADKINNCDLIYLTEIQKAGGSDITTELLKNLGEGKDYNRSVTRPGGEVEVQTIKKGKAIVYTKAIENKYETDDELDRRFPRFPTDMSKAQSIRVIESKASRRTNPVQKSILNDMQTNSLKCHMSNLLKENVNKYSFINPMAEELAKYIPSTFAISRSYADHYFDFIEGVSYFNKRDRMIKDMTIKGENKKVIFVTPEDCWQLHQIYNKQFLQEVLNIPPNGIFILNAFKKAKEQGIKSNVPKGLFTPDDSKSKLTIEQIFNIMKEMGLVVKETLIVKILTDLMMSGYVREEVTQVGAKKLSEYYLASEIANFESNLDWNKIINEGLVNLKKNFPDYYDEYKQRYCLTPKAINPFTGEIVKLIPAAIKTDTRDDWLEIEAQ